jgi:outer membrane lipoprotein-sorting protein
MKQTMLILTALALLPFTAAAQDEDVFGEDGKKGRDILGKVKSKLQGFNTIYIEFESSLHNTQADINEESRGKLFIKGDKFKLHFLDYIVYNNGSTQWTQLIEEKEVNISEPDPEETELANLNYLLQNYDTRYKVKYVAERFEDNRALLEVDLYPKNRDVSYSRITMKVDKDKNIPYEINYVGKDGNLFTFKIKTFSPNRPMEDKIFAFSKTENPGCEVIDMR